MPFLTNATLNKSLLFQILGLKRKYLELNPCSNLGKIILTNMIVDFYEGECDLYVLLALEVDVRPPRGPIHCKRYK